MMKNKIPHEEWLEILILINYLLLIEISAYMIDIKHKHTILVAAMGVSVIVYIVALPFVERVDNEY